MEFPLFSTQLLHGLCTTFPYLMWLSYFFSCDCDTCDVTLSHTPSCVVKKKKRNINNDLAVLPSHDIEVVLELFWEVWRGCLLNLKAKYKSWWLPIGVLYQSWQSNRLPNCFIIYLGFFLLYLFRYLLPMEILIFISLKFLLYIRPSYLFILQWHLR